MIRAERTPGDRFPDTIPHLLEWRAARADPSASWLRFEDDTWTFPDVLAEVDRFAVGLADRGVVQGDTVAILLGNRPETLFAWFAANRLGAIAMPLDPAYKPHELGGVLRLASPRAFVVADDLRSAYIDEASEASPTTNVVSPVQLARSGSNAPRAPVYANDVAVLLATSGPSGAPKAVMQTHRTYTLTAEAFPWWLGLDASDRLLCALPLFHVNAQAYSTMGALGCGAELALLARFSSSRFWNDVRRHGATEVNALGAMVHALLASAPRPSDREHSLRTCYAALALSEEKHRAFEERFGVTMTVGYGLSETTFGTVWPRATPAPPYGTIGMLRQHPRLGVINRGRVVREDGTDAGAGETGELWLSSPAMMRGYLFDPDGTEAAFEGQWFRTGDLVRRDASGIFTFVSRKMDVLRRRGENVAACEIEIALLAHGTLLEAAVVGVPSSLGDDEVVAFVVPRPGASVDPEVLRAFVRERLAEHKVPARVHVRSALPRTASERIAKHLLSET
ncbi:MAG: AMP-binding protein [Labilithrix sp.]|nr:AMP-binding protein [Labilithrix sp.]